MASSQGVSHHAQSVSCPGGQSERVSVSMYFVWGGIRGKPPFPRHLFQVPRVARRGQTVDGWSVESDQFSGQASGERDRVRHAWTQVPAGGQPGRRARVADRG